MMIQYRILIWILLCLVVAGHQWSVEFYVGPGGNDEALGTAEQPFGSIKRGVKAVRDALRQGDIDSEGVSLCLLAGGYSVEKPIVLDETISGKKVSPVVIKAVGGQVVLTGSILLNKWSPIDDSVIRSLLPAAAREHVVCADLRAQGVEDFGQINPKQANPLYLFHGGKFMILARYPNKDWLTIARVPKLDGEPVPQNELYRGRHWGCFEIDDETPFGWKRTDMRVSGYFTFDWFDDMHCIARLDGEQNRITIQPPHHHYGYTPGQRFIFTNVLEALDEPGEWFMDRDSGKLYFWPPDDQGETRLAVQQEELLRLEGAGYVTVEGVTFSGSRGGGVRVIGGTGNLIAGCRFTNLGGTAAVIEGGTNNGVTSCDLYELAQGGIIVNGGDRKMLTPGNHYVTNNHIHHYARRVRTYRPGIQLNGVANRAAHNKIHDCPHMAMGWTGNDLVMEYNEVYRVVTDTNDAGAFYSGRDISMQGNVIRYNYFHDIYGPEGLGTSAVYLDDYHCGHRIYGNVFYRSGRPGEAPFAAMFIHAGRYNEIENNMFIRCEQAYGEVLWKRESLPKRRVSHQWDKRLYRDVNIHSPEYLAKYPWLIDAETDDRPNCVRKNLVFQCESFFKRNSKVLNLAVEDNYITDCDPGFASLEESNFALKPDSVLYEKLPGFEPIPFESIGLYIDQYRQEK